MGATESEGVWGLAQTLVAPNSLNWSSLVREVPS